MTLFLQFAIAVLLAWFGYQLHSTRKVLKTMATRADLNTAIDSATTTIDTAISNLQNQDFSPEIAKVEAIAATAKAADPGSPVA